MLSLYRPGDGILHRAPAGPKLVGAIAVVLAMSLLPTTPWAAATAASACVLAYASAGLHDGMRGMRRLGGALWALRYVVVLMALGQVLLMGVEPAVVNTVRVTAAVIVAGLVTLTTRVTDMLDAIERGLAPLWMLHIDPARVALALTITLSTLPQLAGLARSVREAQRARGVRAGLRTFAVPFLVLSLAHADELGDALAARGVR